MRVLFKKISIVLSCILIITLFSGCTNKTEDAYIYFELPNVPQTLDPQTASSDAELLIIRNIYEGLLRKDADGKIVKGAAKKYDVDGLTYTFEIREDAVWSNGDAVTAHDFVFAFRRAIDPKTKAPFATRLLCIKNAKAINSGKMSSDNLGVSAIDNKTLKITLEYSDKSFENTLTTSVAMPCQEKLFNKAAGKYGLESKFILSNGSYKLTKWNKTSFGIRLYRHEEYNGSFYAKNAAVFLTCNDNETVNEKLLKNSIDIAFVDCADVDMLEDKGLKTATCQNICWVLTLDNNVFSKNMRSALAQLVGGEVYSKSLPKGYKTAQSIFPQIITENPPADGTTIYNLESGRKLYISEINKLKDKKFPTNIILYYYDDGSAKSIVTDIVGHWQSNLSAFVNIESVSDASLLLPELVSTSLPMAIFPIRADSGNIYEYVKKFGFDYNGKTLGEVQKEILTDCTIIPLAYQNTCIAYSKAITNLSTTPGDGYIDFSLIIKDE